MSKYFTKEYIKECKDKRIQGLREYIRVGDVVSRKIKPKCIGCNGGEYGLPIYPVKGLIDEKKDCYWLPTGGQLDEEIVKICNKNGFQYETFYAGNYVFCVEGQAKTYGKNPLIAKIKLLKELIK